MLIFVGPVCGSNICTLFLPSYDKQACGERGKEKPPERKQKEETLRGTSL